ncbi:MAG TPA: hypothetical protein VNL71_08175 [Chloroflexota bacterium]|nr:hypothetical protein [Chloroflexota bacterium]
MMQPLSAPAIRPVEQAGRLLGSMIAAGQSRLRHKRRATDAGTRAAALQVWLKAGKSLAATDDDVEAFVRAYQDAFRSYLLS